MEQWAGENTRCRMAFFHGHIRLAPGETLADGQWMESVDRMEKRLGFTDQPRMVSFHVDQASGEKHLHVAWFRVDLEAQRAIDPGMYKNHLKQFSRREEKIFALREVSNHRQPEDRARIADREEVEESRRLGTDVRAIRTAILDCLEQSDGGKAFKAALDANGLMLANGDRRDCFVVIDEAGGQHALNKKLTGQTLAATRDRLADLDRSQLPGVEQAQATQAERQAVRAAQEARQQPAPVKEAEQGQAAARGPYAPLETPQPAPEAKPARAQTGTAAKIRTAWRESYDANPATDAAQLEKAFDARGIGLAQVTPEEAYASERRAAFAKEIGKFVAPWREGEIVAVDGRGSVYRLNERTTGDDRAVIEGRLAGIDPGELSSVTAAKQTMRETSRAAWQQQKEAERAEARRDAPVSGTAAHIRMAWQTGRTESEFKEALATHSIGLAQVTAAEAAASRAQAELYRERMQTKDATARGPYVTMKTPEPGRYAPQLAEGEIVAVDGRGSVYRLDERTTGDLRPDIEGRLAGIDRAALMNVTDAKEVMQAAALAAWIAERQAEREKTRPATALEGRIIECAEQARHFGAHVQKDEDGTILHGAAAVAYRLMPEEERTGEGAIIHGPAAFAARLDAAGIAIVRVTAADVPALDALRHGEDMARLAAETNNEARPQHHFAALEIGELAAVTRGGDVHSINADKLRGVEIPADLPSVTEARAAFEIDRERTDALYAEHRAEITADRETFAAEREEHTADAHTAREVRETVRDLEAAVDAGLSTTRKVFGAAVKAFETAFSVAFGWAMAGPKLTPQQVHQKAQAAGNVETIHAQAVAAHTEKVEAERDERIFRADQEQQMPLAAPSYFRAVTRPADPADRQHQHDHGQERERER